MTIPADLTDLESRFRPLSADEATFANALLDDAWAILLSQRPNLEAQIDAGTVPEGVATFVLSAMVLRVLRNPNGVKQWSVDDYSETRDSSLAAGSLYVSPEELGLLVPVGAGSGAAFTITPGNDGPGYSTTLPTYLTGWS